MSGSLYCKIRKKIVNLRICLLWLVRQTIQKIQMQYISTENIHAPVPLRTAMLGSNPGDGGLYWPSVLPVIPQAFFNNFAGMSFAEIAYVVANSLFGEEIHSTELKKIVDASFNFEVPVVHVGDDLYSLELFHGPTLAFKDFGARFMARVMQSLVRRRGLESGRINMLIATTGNTAGAVANALHGVEGVELFILFPRGVAGRQLEAQFTTLGGNVHALEVQGSIDDCQALVAQAYADVELNRQLTITSANSANILRLLPQTFYYFHGMARMAAMLPRNKEITVAIPAGNLGNLVAALAARRMGLRMPSVIAAENANDFLTRSMAAGGIETVPARAIPTLAYAADKSRPSNLSRLHHLRDDDFTAVSVNDAGIIDAVNDCLGRYNYVIDPHTALAYHALQHYKPTGNAGLMVATAHPAKSLTAMNAITGRAMDLPLQLTRFMTGRDLRHRIAPTYDALRATLTEV